MIPQVVLDLNVSDLEKPKCAVRGKATQPIDEECSKHLKMKNPAIYQELTDENIYAPIISGLVS